MAVELIINFDEPRERQNFLTMIRNARGTHRITMCLHRNRRSDRQNAFYWGVLIQLFADFLRGQGETIDDEYCHAILKEKFLKKNIVDRRTGEILEYTRSTAKLTTMEFGDYLEKSSGWLAEFFGIIVPPPDPNYWRNENDKQPVNNRTV